MPSPGLIRRKAPPGQGPIATERLNAQIKLLLYSAGQLGLVLLFAWGSFSYAHEWIEAGAPRGDLIPIILPAAFLIWGCFDIPRLRRKLVALKAEELAKRETPSS